jgi:hypothetical protein
MSKVIEKRCGAAYLTKTNSCRFAFDGDGGGGGGGLGATNTTGHFLAIPERPPLPESFSQALISLSHVDDDEELGYLNAGNSYEIPTGCAVQFSNQISPGATVTHMTTITDFQEVLQFKISNCDPFPPRPATTLC